MIPVVPDKFQTVTLILADGRRLRFIGPTCLLDEEIERIRVVDIEISPGTPLPEGYAWNDLVS